MQHHTFCCSFSWFGNLLHLINLLSRNFNVWRYFSNWFFQSVCLFFLKNWFVSYFDVFDHNQIWDLSQNPFQCIRTITGNYGSIYCLAVSSEYNYLLSGTYENKINVKTYWGNLCASKTLKWQKKNQKVYDLSTYKPLHSLEGHIGAVYTLAVWGNRFYSGSYDSTIKVWNGETFKCLQTLVRHTSSVDALVASGNGIFSGGADHSVKVWR